MAIGSAKITKVQLKKYILKIGIEKFKKRNPNALDNAFGIKTALDLFKIGNNL